MKILFYIIAIISILSLFFKIKKKIKYGVVAFVFILIITYFSFLNDYFKYLDVFNNRTHSECIEYFEEFPDGRYYEEVRVIEIEILKNIELVRDFIHEFPKSEFISRVKVVNYELWEVEINNYNTLVKDINNFDYEAVSFFRELLYYMRDNNKSNIYLKLKGNVKVKNFEDYPEDVIQISDLIYEYNEERKVSGNILSLKNNYSQGDINDYEEIINESILESFKSFFSKDFIDLNSSPHSSIDEKNELIIDITYNIKNEEYYDDYVKSLLPQIWIYTTDNSFNSYVLGVSIDFNFDFSIPYTGRKYNFTHNASPLTEIKNIDGVSDGYRQMTMQNFQNYTDIINKKFGLNREPSDEGKSR